MGHPDIDVRSRGWAACEAGTDAVAHQLQSCTATPNSSGRSSVRQWAWTCPRLRRHHRGRDRTSGFDSAAGARLRPGSHPDSTRLIELTVCRSFGRPRRMAARRRRAGQPPRGGHASARSQHHIGFGYGGDDSSTRRRVRNPDRRTTGDTRHRRRLRPRCRSAPRRLRAPPDSRPGGDVAFVRRTTARLGDYDLARRQPVGPNLDPGFEIQRVVDRAATGCRQRQPDRRSHASARSRQPERVAGRRSRSRTARRSSTRSSGDEVMYTIEVGARWRHRAANLTTRRRDRRSGRELPQRRFERRQITIASTVNGRIFQADPSHWNQSGHPFPARPDPPAASNSVATAHS